MSEGQHNILNAAKGLLATKAYGKRRKVEPYIPRRVPIWDDVSEFTRSATTLRTGFLAMHAGRQRCSAAHNRIIKDVIVREDLATPARLS